MMRGLYLCVVFILGTIYASLIVPYTPSARPYMLPPLHVMGRGSGGGDTTLIYIHTATQTITTYDPQTDTHTPIFTCPEACYDPSTDQNGRIGFVTDSGFGIFDPISDDYTQLSTDFGVYGYKGGAAFRSDLAYVAYEGRFNMQMRLLLTDLSTGETTDLGSSGVGNPAWSWDDHAVLVSDGYSLSIVPIDGGDSELVEFELDGVDLFQSYDAENWFFRGMNGSEMGLYLGNPKDTDLIFADDVNSALVTYAITDTLAGMIFFSPRAGNYTISVVKWDSDEVVYELVISYDTIDIALSPDNQYVAWLSENPDMGFGFYDLWIANLSAPSITPIRIAEQISNPSARPSGLAWVHNE